MLDYDRIDVSKKSNDSLERIVCHYYCILFKKTIKCQACVFDDCHDLLHRAVSFDDAVIVIASKIITEFIYGR